MASASTMQPGSGVGGHRLVSGRGRGMMMFAAVVLGVVGFFNLLDGISAVANAHVFNDGNVYVVGSLNAWGWTIMILGFLQLLCAFGVAMDNEVARWSGVVLIGANLLAQMFFLNSYPFWSLVIIAVDVVALWALCSYKGSSEMATE